MNGRRTNLQFQLPAGQLLSHRRFTESSIVNRQSSDPVPPACHSSIANSYPHVTPRGGSDVTARLTEAGCGPVGFQAAGVAVLKPEDELLDGGGFEVGRDPGLAGAAGRT
jgi:hypothetical protein